MQGNRALCAVIAAVSGFLVSGSAWAAPIFAPGNQVVGGAIVGTDFVQGVVGTAAGVNNWPAAESPDHIIDGFGQKYLNFAELNTGAIITPAAPSVANSLTIWTANDSPDRDPATYQLYGTNATITPGAGPYPVSMFTLISSGALALPASRNNGGTTLPGAALLDVNSQTVSFANSTSYSSYLLVFPTVKNSTGANSMQLAEAQLNVPEPASLTLLAIGGVGLLRRRRRA